MREARRTTSLTKSRRNKTPSFVDIEEKYLTPDEETEAECARRKANKLKAMSRFNAELNRQAEDDVRTVRELNRDYAWKIRE